VSNNALAPVRQFKFRVRGQEGGEFRLYRLLHQPLGATAQNISERIVDFVFLTKGNNLTLVHGVTLLRGDSGRLSPTPLRRLLHIVIT
jgi:hypothetical protein